MSTVKVWVYHESEPLIFSDVDEVNTVEEARSPQGMSLGEFGTPRLILRRWVPDKTTRTFKQKVLAGFNDWDRYEIENDDEAEG